MCRVLKRRPSAAFVAPPGRQHVGRADGPVQPFKVEHAITPGRGTAVRLRTGVVALQRVRHRARRAAGEGAPGRLKGVGCENAVVRAAGVRSLREAKLPGHQTDQVQSGA